MEYLPYIDYKVLGGALDEAAFSRYYARACGILDNATHNRIKAMAAVPEAVKSALLCIVDRLHDNEQTGSVASRSQSAGGVSESESYVAKTDADQAVEIENILYDFLGSVWDDNGTPLLYRGNR